MKSRGASVGERYSRLQVVARDGKYALCSCACGSTDVRVVAAALRTGNTRSCGCLRREATRRVGAANTEHGLTATPTYKSWQSMVRRCTNRSDADFERYGGSGVAVHPSWMSFAGFLAYMGVRPSGTTLDRWPNGAGNYEPGNCRWATPTEQNRNRRSVRTVEIDGKRMCLVEACEHLGLNYEAIKSRVYKRGWSVERALSTPIGGNS